jgi:2-phospho-L-lactate guanylyltransferase
MGTLAILPAKRFDHAKQRLAPALDAEGRRVLAEAMLEDVLDALDRAEEVDGVVTVTAEPRARALAERHGAETLDDPSESGQSAAVALGVAAALEHGADRVLLVPGDCPALDPVEVDALLRDAPPAPSVAIVPDRHRAGTNALLLSPPGAIEPAFGPGSLARHLELAADAAVTAAVAEVPSLLPDADTPADLAHLRDVLARRRPRAATLAALAALERDRHLAPTGG